MLPHIYICFCHLFIQNVAWKPGNDFILHQNQKRKRSKVLKLYKNVFHIWQEIVTFYVHIAFNSDISFQFKCLLILNILDLWTDKVKLFLSDVHLCTVVRLTQFCSSKEDKLKILSQSIRLLIHQTRKKSRLLVRSLQPRFLWTSEGKKIIKFIFGSGKKCFGLNYIFLQAGISARPL